MSCRWSCIGYSVSHFEWAPGSIVTLEYRPFDYVAFIDSIMGQRRSFRQADRGRVLLARSTLPGVDLTSGTSRTRMRLLAATFRGQRRYSITWPDHSMSYLSRQKKMRFLSFFLFLFLSRSLLPQGWSIFNSDKERETLLCGGEYTVNACTRNLEPWSMDSEIRAVLSVAFSCQSKRAESR